MRTRTKVIFFSILTVICLAVIVLLQIGSNVEVLNPKGLIAEKEKSLLIFCTWMMLIVVIPVYILVFTVSWKYRASNHKAKYAPENDHSLLAETIWWGVPFIIVIVLSVATWKKSHELDPFKPLVSDLEPIEIQVISLDWKWLFIYPEQNIATVNFIQFPEKTPLKFRITSDAPMNSFWIPQLGSQIYAMAGMETKLNLIANEVGEFRGLSSNLSGLGFSGMRFVAKSSTQEEFEQWVNSTKSSGKSLGTAEYAELSKPSMNNPPTFYSLENKDLFKEVIRKYMPPEHKMH
jgi:cytochrome o ubiquinol oxidase subunit 2